jgi:acetyl-CoA synthetase
MPDVYSQLERGLAAAQLAFAMFGMGAVMTLRDFSAVLLAPRALAVGLAVQLGAVPLLALGLGRALPVPAGIAAGLVLVAAVPGGTLSNLATFLGRGNVALSIALTAVTTVGALATTPALLRLLLGAQLPADFEMPVAQVARDIAATLLGPLAAGMALGAALPARRAQVSRWSIRASLAMILALAVGAAGSGRLDPRSYGTLALLAVPALALCGQLAAVGAGRLAGLTPADRLALGIEATLRNTNLALLVKASLAPAGAGPDPLGDGMLFVALLYGGFALLASIPPIALHRRSHARAMRQNASSPASAGDAARPAEPPEPLRRRWDSGTPLAPASAPMPWAPIAKDPKRFRVRPQLEDYAEACRRFSWAEAERALDGLPGGRGLNIAHEAVDRHAAGPRAGRVALRWLGKAGEVRDFSYADLRDLSSRFANVLSELGVGAGERVFALAGRIPELYTAALGTLKRGAVFCPLFSAFGPEPVRQRLALGRGRVLVTTERLYRRKVEGIRAALPQLEHVLLVGTSGAPGAGAGTHDLHALLERAPERFEIPPTDPEQMALLHFTSGTTGTPKGAIHVHRAVVAHHWTGRLALDFHPDDVFWCTADPGWVTGTSYGIVSPLSHGITSIVDEADFDAERWYALLQDQRVSVWYTAPTAIRMLMKAGPELARKYDLSALRFVASVGEPLNPEAVVWGQEVLGQPIHDNWWQTETGGIMIANYAALEIRPGSMGLPLPGVEAAIAHRSEGGGLALVEEPGLEGELVLRPGWPSLFRGYLDQEERYRKCFREGWYLTGDLARRDADGYFWFVGRADDVIKTAGHLVGPFEVESVLMEHPAVVEAGAIGKPDPIAGDVVKAFVTLRPGFEASEALRLEILAHARTRLGPAVAPREIEFHPRLPRTRSGKIMRRLLRARELGLPEGDLSTLERADAEEDSA